MGYSTRKARGALAGFVDLLWWSEGPAPVHRMERLLPDGSAELVVNLNEDQCRVYDPRDPTRYERLPGGVVVGPHSNFFLLDTAEQQSVVGIHFRPGGVFPFLPLPASELHGLQVGLDDLWGGFARELRECLVAAPNVEARFDLLETALLRQLARPLAHHPAIAYALREFRATHSIARVREATGLSERRFIELFRQQIGLTPKLYCRVRRFQSTLRRIPQGPVDWADVAVSSGYFDQAHLIHDFRAISGLSPGEYAASRTPHLNHVPIV
ncbi:MAG: transcriptional regulator, AraC family [Candidatus Solibacter sp.]|nr:transcriptional regulator, AraC family [Candidatus Solibacter sp.]